MRAGAFLWASALQFFVVQVVVAMAWKTPFNLATRFISDLGNTACGPDVCSPRYALMNASFIVIGITMAAGAVLARDAFVPGWRRAVPIALFIAAGVGVILVGIYPENTDNDRHVLGATINFAAGNTALILFGVATTPAMPGRRGFLIFSVLAGVVGLVASDLLQAGYYDAIGVGTVERLAAYPMSIWQIVAGTRLMLRSAP